MKQKKKYLNNQGQVFIEFLMLLFILVALSRILLGSFNGAISDRWKTMIKVIAKPSNTTIEMR